MKRRVEKKQERRWWARFWREHRRKFDRHDRLGALVEPPTFVRHDVTYEYVPDAVRLEDPPLVVMPASGEGRWIRVGDASIFRRFAP